MITKNESFEFDFSDLDGTVAELEATGFNEAAMDTGDFAAHQREIMNTLKREIDVRESGEFELIDLGREDIEAILGAA